jgi:hypothetical protein
MYEKIGMMITDIKCKIIEKSALSKSRVSHIKKLIE